MTTYCTYWKSLSFVAIILLGATQDIYASPVYWNVFNIEDETAQGARIVTYASLNDMLNDENRTSVIAPDGGFVPENVVGSGSDGTNYWNVFNIEGETAQGARIVTYASLNDMLNDENRTSVIAPDGGFVPENVVGSGSDGTNYWNVFNIEDETAQGARIVTYLSLDDMLNDMNRTGVFAPDGGFVPENVVGSGSDGTTYWNVFNIEGETAQGARIVTYASLNDMLNDENRTSVIAPDGGFVPENVIGSGASVDSQGPGTDPGVVPIASPLALLFAGAFMLPGFSSIRRAARKKESKRDLRCQVAGAGVSTGESEFLCRMVCQVFLIKTPAPRRTVQ